MAEVSVLSGELGELGWGQVLLISNESRGKFTKRLDKDVAALFETLDAAGRTPDVVVYNASNRVRGALVDLAPDDVKRAIEISAFGAFLVSQQAVKRMLPKGEGAVLLSGATAGVKGFALSATFAMGKFALRGLAQSMARELSPKGIHVAHFVIDGGIRSAARPVPDDRPDSLLDPDAIADAIIHAYSDVWGLLMNVNLNVRLIRKTPLRIGVTQSLDGVSHHFLVVNLARAGNFTSQNNLVGGHQSLHRHATLGVNR